MKILYVTTISLTMNSFFKPHIEMLVREGHCVDIACNYRDLELDNLYNELGCNSYQIDFSRSPLSKDNIKAYRQLKKLVENGGYDIVHCHTPNASVITRLVCRKSRKENGLKVFYTAHGFHFYKGAPLKNWLLYYPVEKFCSYMTDVLITINQEDYSLAKKRMKAKKVEYIPGVGIDLSNFENIQVDRKEKRREIGVPEDAIMLISVGEISARKNHKIILQSLTKINNENIHYVIVGQGALLLELQSYAKANGIAHRVHFLGYRKDVVDLYKISDVCCFPSIHEGLPVALMEGMACGKPCVVGNIRGNKDLIDANGGRFFDINSVEDCMLAIMDVLHNDMTNMAKYNKMVAKRYSLENIIGEMRKIYTVSK